MPQVALVPLTVHVVRKKLPSEHEVEGHIMPPEPVADMPSALHTAMKTVAMNSLDATQPEAQHSWLGFVLMHPLEFGTHFAQGGVIFSSNIPRLLHVRCMPVPGTHV